MSQPTGRQDIRHALREHRVEPTRGMGQNFLTDRGVAAWIVDQLEIGPDDAVLEIGPGLGALTEHLTGKGRETLLLEKDARLAARLRQEPAGLQARVIEGDAVRFDLRSLFKLRPLKVIGALPYSCGTEIVRHFLTNPSPVDRAVFVLQKEVVDRMCAAPGTPDRGLLSLRVQARWNAAALRTLPPDIFVPRPRVDSAVVLLTPRCRTELPVFDDAILDRLLRMGFSQRRKMLRKLLPDLGVEWGEVAVSLGFPATARAEHLSLAQWVGLARLADPHVLKDIPQRGEEVFDVVDDANQTIGQRTRREVHALGLRHRAVHVFVLNSRSELFLQKRSHLKDAEPGKWDTSAAGHLDAGEDYLPAAVRELEEELGISMRADQLIALGRISAGPATGWEFVEMFATQWDGRMQWPAAEIEGGAWFPLEEVDAWVERRPQDFASGFIECWKASEFWKPRIS